MPKPRYQSIHGILLLDKPEGISSNRALQIARRQLNAAKAGHGGTLDPLATGMLPIFFGEATKVSALALQGEKTYRCVVKLGQQTDTGDLEGEIIQQMAVPAFDQIALNKVLANHLGEQWQVPPMYSALKHEGQALYHLARQGKVVERHPRRITVSDCHCLAFDPQQLQLQITCSKGTYIRTLAESIAQQLGTCGHLQQLRRLAVSPFALGTVMTPLQWQQTPDLLPLDAVLQHLATVELEQTLAQRFKQGQTVVIDSLLPVTSALRVYHNQQLIGLATMVKPHCVKPNRVFNY